MSVTGRLTETGVRGRVRGVLGVIFSAATSADALTTRLAGRSAVRGSQRSRARQCRGHGGLLPQGVAFCTTIAARVLRGADARRFSC